MAMFPSTIPPDNCEISLYIRWWLGDPSEETLPNDYLIDIIDRNIEKYGDDLCKIVYFSTVDALNWLIRKNAAQDGATGTSGAVNKRREKNGKREIEVEYSDESSVSAGWDSILDDLQTNPSSIGCDPFSDTPDDERIRTPIIGGADINGYQESFRTRNKFGQAIKENRCGYRNTYGRRLF